MMGTHVRFTDTLGYTHVLPVSVLGFRTGADSGNVYVKIDGRCFGAEITPAEYDRLAALLTGEVSEIIEREHDYKRVALWAAWFVAEWRERSREGYRPTTTEDIMSVSAGADFVVKAWEVADGQQPQTTEPDPRTPGQVLHAAYCLEFMSSHVAWSDTGEHTRATWERVAAVLAHGRGNK